MKVSFSTVSQAAIVLLLFLSGVLGQARYDFIGDLAARSERFDQFVRDARLIPQEEYVSPRSLLENDSVPKNKNVDFSIFWEVWDVIESDFYEPEKLNAEAMVDGAVTGLTRSTGDPYTSYFSPKAFERSDQDLSGSFYGVGIELGYKEGILAVVSPLPGTPADKAGVQPGDLIIRVKDDQKDLDEDSSQWSLSKAVDEIRGPLGSDVTLTLIREGAEGPIDITIQRGEIVVKSVILEIVDVGDKRVAHLQLRRFGERTESEWNDAVSTILIEQPNLDGIVLDMRNNPGGYFDGAIDIASEFIKNGVIVSQHGQYSQQDFRATGQARLTRLPLVVLVNGGSASASEIVAGALRDRLEITLVGTQTFGKGTVQDRQNLSNGGGIHITIARWMLPSGEWIHDEGIPVDVEVENDPNTEDDEVLLRSVEFL